VIPASEDFFYLLEYLILITLSYYKRLLMRIFSELSFQNLYLIGYISRILVFMLSKNKQCSIIYTIKKQLF